MEKIIKISLVIVIVVVGTIILIMLLQKMMEGKDYEANCYVENNPQNVITFKFHEWNGYHAQSYTQEKCKQALCSCNLVMSYKEVDNK